jgi:transcription elongation factor GreA
LTQNARGPSIEEATDLFLDSLKTGRSEAQQELLKLLRWFGRERPLTDLTPADLESYGELLASRVPGKEKRVKPLRDFLSFTRKRGLVHVNLASHLRLRRPSRGRRTGANRVPLEPTSPIQLTADGRRQMEERLVWLREETVRAAAEIKKAAADKDVRENAPLEAARQYQGQITSRMHDIEATLERAQLLSANSADAPSVVRQGSRVTLRELGSGEEFTYLLVALQEANSLEGKLSVASPVGQELLGRREGEEFQVTVPGGTLRYQVISTS